MKRYVESHLHYFLCCLQAKLYEKQYKYAETIFFYDFFFELLYKKVVAEKMHFSGIYGQNGSYGETFP